MEDRPAFVGETFKKKGGIAIRKVDTSIGGVEEHVEIVRVYDSSGAIYDRFDLVLPKKSIVRRPQDNKIEIETKKLKMSVAVRFEGFGAVLPEGFEQCYLGITNQLDITEYTVNVDVQISMKLGALFSGAGWQYYGWIDSFLNKLEEHISEDAFFKRLDWESVFTVLQCLKRTGLSNAERK